MGCLPQSGKCERQRTDPFVNHVNDVEGSQYVHELCLDQHIRHKPQPEVLYTDHRTNAVMTIERKNFSWPLDYAKQHNFEHMAIDQIRAVLGAVCDDAPFELTFTTRPNLGIARLARFTTKLGNQIIRNIDRLYPGQEIEIEDDDGRWRFRLQKDEERDYWEPASGLIVRLPTHRTNDLDNPKEIPQPLLDQIARTFTACVAKFAEYPQARNILLIECFGELLLCGEWWWKFALRKVAPPQEIDEIWKAYYGDLTEEVEGWWFEKIHTNSSGAL